MCVDQGPREHPGPAPDQLKCERVGRGLGLAPSRLIGDLFLGNGVVDEKQLQEISTRLLQSLGML